MADSASPERHVPVAIVGMAGMLPGSSTVREYFANVLRGRCFIHDLPADVWEQDLFYCEDRREPFTTYCRIGGLLDRRPGDLDMAPFRIPPAVARQMSGNQKLALVCAREALRDAGFDARPFDRARTGVVMAAVSGDRYESSMESIVSRRVRHRLESLDLSATERLAITAAFARYDERHPPWPITEDTLPGASANLVAGRIASAFDLHGFNETIDSACASSLAAVSRGVAALRLGQCDLVLVGGVDTDMSANAFVQFSKIGAVSAHGSFPFDARADGFVMGQGCGMLVLRRLDDSVAAGDRILAVIRGCGASSDGAGKGITAASSAGQLLALERACADAGIDPAGLHFVECHGTGTVAGDAAELASVAALVRRAGRPTELPIGSAKAMVGHLKVAAGMAGLFRAILAINARVVPPQVNFDAPTPAFDWATSGLRVPRRAEPLDAAEIRVGVSGFGFGGTNHHVILATSPAAARPPLLEVSPFVLPHLGPVDGDTAFLFPGQGSQYAGMLASVCDEPVVMDLCRRADAIVGPLMGRPLSPLLFAGVDDAAARAALRSTAVAQPAIFVASAAFLELARARGASCGVAFGHSLGEYAALHAAGVLSFEEALTAVTHRGRLMAECVADDPGAMAVLRCGADAAGELVAATTGTIVCANLNAYDQTVVSGATGAVGDVIRAARAAGITAATLATDRGFHSPLLADCVPPLRVVLETLRPRATAIPVLANRSRRLYPCDPEARGGRPLTAAETLDFISLLAEQAVRPVDFVGQVETAYAGGIRRFVEIGPRGVLTGLVSEILAGRPFQTVAIDAGGPPATTIERLRELLAEPVKIPRRAVRGHPTRAPQPAAAATAAPAVNLAAAPPATLPPRDRVLAVVAAVTGYEPAAVADDAEFERDLGIDTLKIFDIVSRLTGDVLPTGFSRLRDATSVAKILALAGRQDSPALPRSTPEVDGQNHRPGEEIESAAARQPRPEAAADRPVRGFRITTFATAARPTPRAVARRVVVGPRFDSPDFDLSAVRSLHDPSSADALLVWPLPASPLAVCEQALPELVTAVLAEAAIARGRSIRPEITLLTLGPEREVDAGSHRAMAAAFKSFQKDLHDLRFAHWHVASTRPDSRHLATVLANPLLGPLLHGDLAIERERLVPLDLDAGASPGLATLLGPDDTILVTGGARGIAALVVRHLLGCVSSRFLLVGRDPVRQPWMDEAGPGRIECLAADVGDAAAVERLALAARGVTLVVHAAGVVRSRPLARIERADMESLLRPKVHGLHHVVAAADTDRLRGVVCFSSLAATLGGDGHPDYAVGNACLDGYRHPRVPVLSIGWSAWDGAGMATDDRTRRFLDLSGVALIPAARGVAAFETLLARFLATSGPRTEAFVVHAGLDRGCVLARDACGWDLLDDSPEGSSGDIRDAALLVRHLRPRPLEPLVGPGDFAAVLDAVIEPPATLAIGGVALLALAIEPVADFAIARGDSLFTAAETAELATCGTERRRRHKAAGKLAAKLLACEIARRRHGLDIAAADVEVRSAAGPVQVEIVRADTAACAAVWFSISHSDGVVCVAAADRAVGIDVEEIRPLDAGTARRIRGDVGGSAARDPRGAIARFTRKEAVLKAAGVGIGDGLDDVTLAAAAEFGEAAASHRGRRYVVATEIVGERVVSIAVAEAAVTPEEDAAGRAARRVVAVSPVQQSLWLVERLGMAGAALAFGWTERFAAGVDIRQLGTAVECLVARHESLRTTFREEAGRCVAEVAAVVPVDLPVEEVPDAAAVSGRSDALAREPFDLEMGPLFRFRLFRTGPEEYVLLLLFHHLVIDVSSALVFRHELRGCLAAIAARRNPALPPLPITFSGHAARHRAALTPERVADLGSWWRNTLGGVDPEPPLVTDFRRGAGGARRVASIPFDLPQPTVSALEQVSRRAGGTLFATFLAAFATLVARLSGRDDVVVGTPFAGRSQPDTRPLVGCFVTMLPLRLRIPADAAFAEILSRARDAVLDAVAHHELPFERIVEAVNPPRLAGATPLFQPVIRFLHEADGPPGTAVTDFAELPAVGTLYDLSLVVLASRDAARCRFEYDADLFHEATISRMSRQFTELLEAVAADATRPIGSFLSPRREVAPAPAIAWPRIDDAFAARVAQHPDAVALVEDGRAVSYGDLAARAARLARHLRARGVTEGGVVGICMPRSIDMVVAWLAVLEAGAAYLPIDPDYPAARIGRMLADTATTHVVTRGVPCPGLPPEITSVDIVRDADEIAGGPASRPLGGGDAECTAYVMFTSGSTGRPKGVAIPHRGVTSLIGGLSNLSLDESATLLHHSPPTFDASTFEVWGCLLYGGRCVLAMERVPAPGTLRSLIHGQRVNVLWLTSALFNVLVDEAPDILRPVRTLIVGGEPLSVPHVRRGLAALPDTTLVNGYGPTECTTFTTLFRVPRDLDDRLRSIPIGQPLGSAVVHLLDSQGRPVPDGAVGEIHVGGPGLALGYVGDPQATATRFVPDMVTGVGLMYRTGDLARHLPDGTLEFLGRNDDQVKIRGHRVEPGEIETVLAAHPGVGQAGCVVVGGATDRRLVAHVVPADPATARSQPMLSGLVSELGRLLAATLPKHAIPDTLVIADRLPLSAHGKVDRRALAAALPASATTRPRSPRPAHPTEALVASVWESILGVEGVGATDDFFALGGTSLTAVAMAARVEALLGRRVPLTTLFTEATVAALCRAILAANDTDDPPVVELQRRVGAVPLVFLHGDFLGGGLYCRQLAAAIGPDRPLLVLQPHGLAGQPVRATVHDMAAAHVALLRTVLPQGPYRLAGYCNGALEAFEMARLLAADGAEVDFVGLIAPPPVPRRATPPVTGEESMRSGGLATAPVAATRWDALVACGRACAAYRPTPLDRHVTIIQPADDVAGLADAAAGWRAVAGQVDLHVIPGGHETMVARHAADLGRVLAGCLRRLDGAGAADLHDQDVRQARVLFSLGNALKDERRFREAARAFLRSLRLDPGHAAAAYNLGNALKDQGHRRLSAAAFRRAVAIDPAHADAWMNLGNALRFQGRLDEAIACFDRAVAIRPDHPRARWNRALVRLVRGDWQRGWDDFEFRWASGQQPRRHLGLPAWDGRPLPAGSILLEAEQGLGDTMQFVRYARLVRRRVGRVVLECQRSLVPLLASVPGIDAIVARGDAPPRCDVQAALMSLPRLFGTTPETVPREVPYIAARAELVDAWRPWIAGLPGLRVGLAWRGNAAYPEDQDRSPGLAACAGLGGVAGVSFVPLQKRSGDEDAQAARALPLLWPPGPVDEAAGAFMDTAAILTHLDLVITSDTAMAHLAGALGVETWVVLPAVADWRWLMDRDDSPWYPTLRLFRQERPGDWAGVFERVRAALEAAVGRQPPAGRSEVG